MTRSRGDDVGEVLMLLVLYTLIGIGPLFSTLLLMEGMFPPEDPASYVASSPIVFWLALVMLGCVLGWTLSGLAVDYERFWRLPGRLKAFERIVAEQPGNIGLPRSLGANTDAVSLLRYRWLRTHGVKVLRNAPLTFIYVSVRGAWLGAALSIVVLLVEASRATSSDAGVDPVTILGFVVSGVVFLATTGVSKGLGRRAAWQVISALRVQAAHSA